MLPYLSKAEPTSRLRAVLNVTNVMVRALNVLQGLVLVFGTQYPNSFKYFGLHCVRDNTQYFSLFQLFCLGGPFENEVNFILIRKMNLTKSNH